LRSYSIAGVNEHFNFPWKFGIESGAFKAAGIHLQWTDIPGGTGEMTRLLDEGKLDFAVLLTEGILSDIIRKQHSRFLQFHVNSPLLWGVHARKEHSLRSLDDLEKMRFAISRYGSGSHMMVLVLAKNKGWDISKLRFEVVNSISGGLHSLQSNESDIFLWEKYTTRPFLEEFGLAYLGEVPTPWPGFALAANEKICREVPELVRSLMKSITSLNAECTNDPQTISRISRMYNLTEFEVENWKAETNWNTLPGIMDQDLQEVLKKLQQAGLITEAEAKTPPEKIIFRL
jgi:sulfonate transport system substrate-binding protein